MLVSGSPRWPAIAGGFQLPLQTVTNRCTIKSASPEAVSSLDSAKSWKGDHRQRISARAGRHRRAGPKWRLRRRVTFETEEGCSHDPDNGARHRRAHTGGYVRPPLRQLDGVGHLSTGLAVRCGHHYSNSRGRQHTRKDALCDLLWTLI